MTVRSTSFQEYLISELKCASLRARIMQADIEAVDTALRANLISADQAIKLLSDCDALRIVGTPPSEGSQ